MEQRENFITPMGTAAADSLATPHFDEEATLLAARPVVPLEQVTATPAPRQKKSLLLPIVIVAAALAGAAGAMAFDYFRNHRQANAATTPTSAQPAPPVAETSRAVAQPSAPPVVNVVAPSNKTPDATAIVPATESANASKEAKASATERTERNVNNNNSSSSVEAKRAEREAAVRATQAAEAKQREEARAKSQKVSPPVITHERPRQVERPNDEVETDWRDIREQRREARREERRRERQADQDGDDSPRQQRERANRELNRIRDIFEGTRRP